MTARTYWLILVIALQCSSLPAAAPVLDTAGGAAPVSYTTATLNGNLTAGLASNTVRVYWGQDTNAWDGTNSLGWRSVGAFWSAVSNLAPGTSYYYRCSGSNADGVGWSDVASFTTRVLVLKFNGGSYDGYDRDVIPVTIGFPRVNNASGATNVTSTHAWLNGMLVSTGNTPATVSVYWGTADGGTNKGDWGQTNDFGNGVNGQIFSTNVSLASNTAYYYRFYATNAAGEGWADSSATFLTLAVPVLDTGAGAAPLSYTTATLNGNLTAGGSAAVTLYWGQDTNAWANTNGLGTLGQGAFLAAVSNLAPGTPYYYRCYGSNSQGIGWSDTVAFTTPLQALKFTGGSYDGYDGAWSFAVVGFPRVNNASGATNVTSTNAWLNGMLVSTGNTPAAVSVYWGTADGGTNKGDWGHTNDFGNGVNGQMFSTNVSLASNTAYYYRFYATNAAGEGWADSSATFLTLATPVLNTGAGAAPLSYTTATLNGNLTAGGSAAVTLYWGQDTNAWANTNGLGTLGQGAFLAAVSNLAPGTPYYYRCHGSNSQGIGWSDTAAFTTPVQALKFTGGSYDGYDEHAEHTAMQSYKGTLFVIY